MADEDIDIEEHDILENPALRRIFPDISIVKKEIAKSYEDIKQEDIEISEILSTTASECAKVNILNNPQVPHRNIKHESISDADNKIHSEIQTQQSWLGNKIILGSKPSATVVRIPRIVIHDLGPSLKQNEKYCKDCLRVFSSKLHFDDHVRSVHSVTPQNNQQNIKEKTKPNITKRSRNNKKISQKDILTNTETHSTKSSDFDTNSLNRTNVCFHCKKSFPSQESLIDHIYETLSKNNTLKPLNDKDVSRNNEVDKTNTTHQIKNKKIEVKKTFKNKPFKSKLVYADDDTDSSDCQDSGIENQESESIGTAKELKKGIIQTQMKNPDQVLTVSVAELTVTAANSFRSRRIKNKHNHQSLDGTDSEYLPPEILDSSLCSEPPMKKNKLDKPNSNDKTVITTPDVAQVKSKSVNNKPNDKTLDDNDSESLSLKRRLETPEHQDSSLRPRPTKKKAKQNKEKSSKVTLTSKKGLPIPQACINDNSKTRSSLAIKKNIRLRKTEEKYPKDSIIEKDDNTNKCVDEMTDKLVYQCLYCSYIVPTAKAYYTHVVGKHKLEKVLKVNRVKFDTQCKYCPSKYSNEKANNSHIYVHHYDLLNNNAPKVSISEDEENHLDTVNPTFEKYKSFVLESVIYKCNRCDIFFLSSFIASHHKHHMEILVNWKCNKCSRIFKKCDKHLHLKQHKMPKTLTVCEVNETETSMILYCCTKCTIHFTEEMYMEHYSNCSKRTTDTKYCRFCDMLIDKYEYNNHELSHQSGKNISDFTIIASAIIEDKDKKETDLPKKRKRQYEQVNCLTFCQTCKCYLSDKGLTRKAHIEARCAGIPKNICNMCGLVFTHVSIRIHRMNHRKEPNLTLQDFKFFDLKGIQINPPIPKYPHCSNCNCHFVSKKAITFHVCTETDYVTCTICQIKLSENAYKLHKKFHDYSLDKVNALSAVSSQRPIINDKAEETRTDRNKNDDALPIQENVNRKYDCNTQVNEMNKHNSSKETEIREIEQDKQKNDSVTLESEEQNDCVLQQQKLVSQKQNTEGIDEDVDSDVNTLFLYSCQSCVMASQSYDKVVEHCQSHYTPVLKHNPLLKICTKCSLKFDSDTFKLHQKTHSSNIKYQLITYDPTYFVSDNKTWIQNIFKTIPDAQIIKHTSGIYHPECRIKMDVVQKGPSHLTVYKCDKCGNFIDPDCLLKHVKDCVVCPSVIKHSCSVCGLPFNSQSMRKRHEHLHSLYKDIRIKSYNIVLINRDAHSDYNNSILNAIKQYILYQCRACNGIVDKMQRIVHPCNTNNLKKCSICKLLIYNSDLPEHISKHKRLPRFKVENMKVILFGSGTNDPNSDKLHPSFTGMVYDYTLYKCSKCAIHFKHYPINIKHVCIYDKQVECKCYKCGFFFIQRNLKSHLQMHDLDPEYNIENIKIIDFE